MQIEEIRTASSALRGRAHYFTAILLKDWEFWISGPSSHSKQDVLVQLTQYQNAVRVQLIEHYVPFLQ